MEIFNWHTVIDVIDCDFLLLGFITCTVEWAGFHEEIGEPGMITSGLWEGVGGGNGAKRSSVICGKWCLGMGRFPASDPNCWGRDVIVVSVPIQLQLASSCSPAFHPTGRI